MNFGYVTVNGVKNKGKKKKEKKQKKKTIQRKNKLEFIYIKKIGKKKTQNFFIVRKVRLTHPKKRNYLMDTPPIQKIIMLLLRM